MIQPVVQPTGTGQVPGLPEKENSTVPVAIGTFKRLLLQFTSPDPSPLLNGNDRGEQESSKEENISNQKVSVQDNAEDEPDENLPDFLKTKPHSVQKTQPESLTQDADETEITLPDQTPLKSKKTKRPTQHLNDKKAPVNSAAELPEQHSMQSEKKSSAREPDISTQHIHGKKTQVSSAAEFPGKNPIQSENKNSPRLDDLKKQPVQNNGLSLKVAKSNLQAQTTPANQSSELLSTQPFIAAKNGINTKEYTNVNLERTQAHSFDSRSVASTGQTTPEMVKSTQNESLYNKSISISGGSVDEVKFQSGSNHSMDLNAKALFNMNSKETVHPSTKSGALNPVGINEKNSEGETKIKSKIGAEYNLQSSKINSPDSRVNGDTLQIKPAKLNDIQKNSVVSRFANDTPLKLETTAKELTPQKPGSNFSIAESNLFKRPDGIEVRQQVVKDNNQAFSAVNENAPPLSVNRFKNQSPSWKPVTTNSEGALNIVNVKTSVPQQNKAEFFDRENNVTIASGYGLPIQNVVLNTADETHPAKQVVNNQEIPVEQSNSSGVRIAKNPLTDNTAVSVNVNTPDSTDKSINDGNIRLVVNPVVDTAPVKETGKFNQTAVNTNAPITGFDISVQDAALNTANKTQPVKQTSVTGYGLPVQNASLNVADEIQPAKQTAINQEIPVKQSNSNGVRITKNPLTDNTAVAANANTTSRTNKFINDGNIRPVVNPVVDTAPVTETGKYNQTTVNANASVAGKEISFQNIADETQPAKQTAVTGYGLPIQNVVLNTADEIQPVKQTAVNQENPVKQSGSNGVRKTKTPLTGNTAVSVNANTTNNADKFQNNGNIRPVVNPVTDTAPVTETGKFNQTTVNANVSVAGNNLSFNYTADETQPVRQSSVNQEIPVKQSNSNGVRVTKNPLTDNTAVSVNVNTTDRTDKSINDGNIRPVVNPNLNAASVTETGKFNQTAANANTSVAGLGISVLDASLKSTDEAHPAKQTSVTGYDFPVQNAILNASDESQPAKHNAVNQETPVKQSNSNGNRKTKNLLTDNTAVFVNANTTDKTNKSINNGNIRPVVNPVVDTAPVTETGKYNQTIVNANASVAGKEISFQNTANEAQPVRQSAVTGYDLPVQNTALNIADETLQVRQPAVNQKNQVKLSSRTGIRVTETTQTDKTASSANVNTIDRTDKSINGGNIRPIVNPDVNTASVKEAGEFKQTAANSNTSVADKKISFQNAEIETQPIKQPSVKGYGFPVQNASLNVADEIQPAKQPAINQETSVKQSSSNGKRITKNLLTDNTAVSVNANTTDRTNKSINGGNIHPVVNPDEDTAPVKETGKFKQTAVNANASVAGNDLSFNNAPLNIADETQPAKQSAVNQEIPDKQLSNNGNRKTKNLPNENTAVFVNVSETDRTNNSINDGNIRSFVNPVVGTAPVKETGKFNQTAVKANASVAGLGISVLDAALNSTDETKPAKQSAVNQEIPDKQLSNNGNRKTKNLPNENTAVSVNVSETDRTNNSINDGNIRPVVYPVVDTSPVTEVGNFNQTAVNTNASVAGNDLSFNNTVLDTADETQPVKQPVVTDYDLPVQNTALNIADETQPVRQSAFNQENSVKHSNSKGVRITKNPLTDNTAVLVNANTTDRTNKFINDGNIRPVVNPVVGTSPVTETGKLNQTAVNTNASVAGIGISVLDAASKSTNEAHPAKQTSVKGYGFPVQNAALNASDETKPVKQSAVNQENSVKQSSSIGNRKTKNPLTGNTAVSVNVSKTDRTNKSINDGNIHPVVNPVVSTATVTETDKFNQTAVNTNASVAGKNISVQNAALNTADETPPVNQTSVNQEIPVNQSNNYNFQKTNDSISEYVEVAGNIKNFAGGQNATGHIQSVQSQDTDSLSLNGNIDSMDSELDKNADFSLTKNRFAVRETDFKNIDDNPVTLDDGELPVSNFETSSQQVKTGKTDEKIITVNSEFNKNKNLEMVSGDDAAYQTTVTGILQKVILNADRFKNTDTKGKSGDRFKTFQNQFATHQVSQNIRTTDYQITRSNFAAENADNSNQESMPDFQFEKDFQVNNSEKSRTGEFSDNARTDMSRGTEINANDKKSFRITGSDYDKNTFVQNNSLKHAGSLAEHQPYNPANGSELSTFGSEDLYAKATQESVAKKKQGSQTGEIKFAGSKNQYGVGESVPETYQKNQSGKSNILTNPVQETIEKINTILKSGNSNVMNFQVYDQKLGDLRFRINKYKDRYRVKIIVENYATREILADNLNFIKETFENSQYQINTITVDEKQAFA